MQEAPRPPAMLMIMMVLVITIMVLVIMIVVLVIMTLWAAHAGVVGSLRWWRGCPMACSAWWMASVTSREACSFSNR